MNIRTERTNFGMTRVNQKNQSPRFARFSQFARTAFKPSMKKVSPPARKVETCTISKENVALLERLSKVTWKSGKRAFGKFYLEDGTWLAELKYTTGACKQVIKRVEEAVDGTLFVRFNQEADFITGTKEDDIKTREYVMWNREQRDLTSKNGESIKVGPPRTWVHFYQAEKISKATEEQQSRADEILSEAKRIYKDYVATVLDFSETCGVKVMWTSAPKELKEKYNVTDLKTFDSWCLDWEFNSDQLRVGMKVRMRPDSVQCKGKYNRRPLIRGVLLEVLSEPQAAQVVA